MSELTIGGEAYQAAEYIFRHNFASAAGALTLGEALVPKDTPTDGGLPLEAFRFIAITASADRPPQPSREMVAYDGDIPADVGVEYYQELAGVRDTDPFSRPFMGAGGAIALVGNFTKDGRTFDMLLALASAGVEPSMRVADNPADQPVYGVRQLQAFVRADLQPDYVNALRNSGFSWAETLTRAHEIVASRLGFSTVALLCDQRGTSERAERVRSLFGGVAHAQGYRRVRHSALARIVWKKSLTPAA